MLRLLAALIAPLLITQGTFEGKLRMRSVEIEIEEQGLKEAWLDVAPSVAAAREDADVDSAELQVKNNVLRLESSEEGEGYGLVDFTRHVMIMVDPASKVYMEIPLPANTGPQAGAKPGAPVVTPLGKTRTMNGASVTAYEVRGKDQILRAWMTKDFPGLTGTFRAFASRLGDSDDPEDAAVTELMRFGFPVLLITLTDRSVRYEEMISVERTTLNADLFKVPAGFTKRTMPGARGGP